MNLTTAILLIAILAALILGWYGRKFVERIASLEAIVKRRHLPYNVAAGLEDAWATIDLAQFQNLQADKMTLLLMQLLQAQIKTRTENEAALSIAEQIVKGLREDHRSYEPDKPIKNR